MEASRATLMAERADTIGVDEQIKQMDEVAVRLREQRAEIEARLNAAQHERGRLDASLAQCALASADKPAVEKEIASARRSEEIYKQLVGAFGRQGVQALIIENVVPEIQEHANELLSRLTDHGMKIAIETKRAAKSKGAGEIETLDIIVSDSIGTRALELYSGGETLRISFALRIALSKLLARRAGARLQTLIIDEGFGSQDATGREKLVQAIHEIKADFDKIIVITHVEDLKDEFPSRIEVLKTPLGSQVTVIAGGITG
jgi:exonuclease SbcC